MYTVVKIIDFSSSLIYMWFCILVIKMAELHCDLKEDQRAYCKIHRLFIIPALDGQFPLPLKDISTVKAIVDEDTWWRRKVTYRALVH
jgi:hypothetical protein